MKFRIALLAMLVVAAAPLAAQGGGRGGFGGGINVERMTTLYGLTTDQVTKVDVLKKSYDASTAGVQAWMTKLREGGSDPAAMRDAPGFADSTAKLIAARGTFDAEFKKLLTAAQVVTFDSVQAARAARMRPAGGF